MTDASDNTIRREFAWPDIDTVLLDMDGTLLDKYFDDYFWEHYIPEIYAAKNGLNRQQAEQDLMSRYRSVERTLQWADLDYWTEQLGLDIVELKKSIDHLIDVHPYVVDFLHFLEHAGKTVYLVTAAHRKTLQIKMEKTSLTPLFKRIICAEELKLPKEAPQFWQRLEELLGFERRRTLLADDTAAVLRAARDFGIAHLVFAARPSSRAPIRHSKEFPSIIYFNELMSETSSPSPPANQMKT